MSTPRPSIKRVTIKDVARSAGVSPSTVSNVLNGRTGEMTDQTLRNIYKAIKSLKYRPSSVARGLVTRRTATIGLILSEIETPLFLQALNYIEPIARLARFNVLLSNAASLEDEREAVNLLLEKEVDGIIFLSISEHRANEHLLELDASGIPFVLINRPVPLEHSDQVGWNNAEGIRTAIDHLAALGHRRIAHLQGPLNRRSSEERLRGYQEGLGNLGLDYRADYVRSGDYTAGAERWQQSTLELLALSPRPTAIVASADNVAAVAIKTLQEAGLHVPRDISVVGFDNQPFCTYINPSLTTVELPVTTAGKHAIELLLNRIQGIETEPERRVLPCPLIVRASTGPTPS